MARPVIDATIYVSADKERRARMIVQHNGRHPRRKSDEMPCMEEVAYTKAKNQFPTYEGEDLVREVYLKLKGIILKGPDAAKEIAIRKRDRERDMPK